MSHECNRVAGGYKAELTILGTQEAPTLWLVRIFVATYGVPKGGFEATQLATTYMFS